MADAFARYFSRELEHAYSYVDLLCRHLCFQVFHELQLFQGGSGTIAELRARAGIVSQAEYVLTTILHLLAEEGILHQECGVWTLQEPCPPDDTQRLQAEARLHCLDAAAILDLIGSCHNHALAFLTGREPGIAAIFPRGDLGLWERVHSQDRIMSTYADLIRPALEFLPSHRGVRVLEIGAGVGSVLRRVLPLLRRLDIGEYWFTDVGRLFVQRAQQIYGNETFLRFGVVDLNLPLENQGLDPTSFDFVVGVNVLHLPKNLQFTLRELRSIMKTSGYLICAEGSPPHPGKRWPLDVVFGFLHGWWDVSIGAWLRPRPGFLFPAEWVRILGASGFSSVMALPGEDWFAGACRGGLVVASADRSQRLPQRKHHE